MNNEIQTLRGLACLMVVFYHVVGFDPDTGLRIQSGWLRSFNDGLAYVHMPLFTMLSGMVYALHPVRSGQRFGAFLVNKAGRLLVPMLVVGTLFALVRANTPGANISATDWTMLHILPVAHYWYIESIFWIFLTIFFVDRHRLADTPRAWALLALVSVLACVWLPVTALFSLVGAFYLFPFFLLGLGLFRFGQMHRLQPRAMPAGLLAASCLVVYLIGHPSYDQNRHSAMVLLAGVLLCLLCVSLRPRIGWLARVGDYSYTIYLYHVFFTAAARMLMKRLGLDDLWINLCAGLCCGVLVPMAIDRLLGRSPWLGLLLLGNPKVLKNA